MPDIVQPPCYKRLRSNDETKNEHYVGLAKSIMRWKTE